MSKAQKVALLMTVGILVISLMIVELWICSKPDATHLLIALNMFFCGLNFTNVVRICIELFEVLA